MADKEKIKLHAVYRKDGTITICDQDGREFEAEPSTYMTANNPSAVLIELELEAPHWFLDKPRANIKISVPLDVEERLPEWMVEHLEFRYGHG